jgi:hypothetical protein
MLKLKLSVYHTCSCLKIIINPSMLGTMSDFTRRWQDIQTPSVSNMLMRECPAHDPWQCTFILFPWRNTYLFTMVCRSNRFICLIRLLIRRPLSMSGFRNAMRRNSKENPKKISHISFKSTISTFLLFLGTTLVWGIVPVTLTIPPWIREMVEISSIFRNHVLFLAVTKSFGFNFQMKRHHQLGHQLKAAS